MADIQEQMNAILSNPEMMQKIMAMAQAMQPSQDQKREPAPTKQDNPGFSMPDIDPSMVQKLSRLAWQSNIDKNQKNLLNALAPYLSQERISKLERAMRAAKMANMASSFLGKSGFQFHTGR